MNNNIIQKFVASSINKVGEKEVRQAKKIITSSDITNVENQQEVVSSEASEALRNSTISRILIKSKDIYPQQLQVKNIIKEIKQLCQKDILVKNDKGNIKTLLSIQNNDILPFQLQLAQKAIKDEILDKNDKDTFKNLLKTPSDKPDLLCQQLDLAIARAHMLFLALKLLDEDDKDIVKNLLKTPSDEPYVLCKQLDLAKARIFKGFLDQKDKDIVKNLLKTPSDDPHALYKQLDLAITGAYMKFLDKNDKDTFKNLLKTPSDDPHALYKQLNLASLEADMKFLDKNDKDIVKNLLKTPSDDPNMLCQQLNLASYVANLGFLDKNDKDIVKNLLDKNDKDIVANLLKTPSDNPDLLYYQLKFMKKAFGKDYFEKDNDDDKNIINNLLKMPSDDTYVIYQQLKLAITAADMRLLNKNDKNIVTNLLKTPSDKPGLLYHQLRLALDKNDKDIVANLLKTPSDNPDLLYYQLKFMKKAIEKDCFDKDNDDDKNIINNLLKMPSNDSHALYKQLDLAITGAYMKFLDKNDKDIVTNLLKTPSDDPNVLCQQLNLASTGVYMGFLDKNDKDIVKNLLKTPSDKPDLLYHQLKLMKKVIEKDCFDKDNDGDKNIINNFLKTPSDDHTIFHKQMKLINTAIELGLLRQDYKETTIFSSFSETLLTFIQDHKIETILPLLSNEKLSAIIESQFIKDAKDDRKQFELEYIIDLKISRGLYQDNWDSLAQTIINNASILTPVGNTDIHNDGIFNISVTALKQMPLSQRTTFLNKIFDKTKNQNLKALLKNNQCDNDKLLTIRPVLRQYDKKVGFYESKQHSYRMPRTTDRCEVFSKNGKTMLGYKGTSQFVKTNLTQEQIEYLFGEQRPNGNQAIGNCWLIAELKHIMYDPKLKLLLMNTFSMDNYGSVSIKLKNGKKVTFTKDIVNRASKIAKNENLPPAMACLSLLAAINRTFIYKYFKITPQIFENNIKINEDKLKDIFKNSPPIKDIITFSDEYIKDPIMYALRIFNKGGNSCEDLLSLFFYIAPYGYKPVKTLNDNKKTIKPCLHTPGHTWSVYDDTLAANPQHSNTLFDTRSNDNDNNDESVSDNFSQDEFYFIPNINPSTHKFYTVGIIR
ncbi:MAG: hypothetical protein BHW64_02300 [Candidatus Melainabacteria bacterium LEY3_CP_29_8]|nr:MAG: hypothetical protein BHW64_02300 [Candidatus Melainabacteria bacterium LEY3_CP_29_8]